MSDWNASTTSVPVETLNVLGQVWIAGYEHAVGWGQNPEGARQVASASVAEFLTASFQVPKWKPAPDGKNP